jgi:hypothetical protein
MAFPLILLVLGGGRLVADPRPSVLLRVLHGVGPVGLVPLHVWGRRRVADALERGEATASADDDDQRPRRGVHVASKDLEGAAARPRAQEMLLERHAPVRRHVALLLA